jgi:hypothetical protein
MRDFWRASAVCLLIALAVSVVIACSHRYSLVAPPAPTSGSELEGELYQVVVYRIDHWTGRVALIRPDLTPGHMGVQIHDHMRFNPPPPGVRPRF